MDTDRALFNPQLSIVGDVGVDLVLGTLDAWPRIGTELLMPRSELRAGGSGANAALAARHIGLATQLVSAVGHDHFGQWLSEQFAGLRCNLEVCDRETTISVGLMHSCGERNFFTTQGHLQQLSIQHVLKHLRPTLTRAIALFTAPFLLTELRRRYADLLAEAATRGYGIALDTGWPPEGWTPAVRDEVLTWLPHCDHLLVNELEARQIAGTEDLDEALRWIATALKPGASLVVKVGARGALGSEGGRRAGHEAEPADIFDTIGAGDAFNAGYLAARLRGGDLAEGLAAGCRTARAILSRFPRKTIRAGEFAGLPGMKHRALIVGYILLIWFVISFVTNLIGPLMPIIIQDFKLSLAMAGFLPFSFFLAYGLISIPGGMLVEARGSRFTLLAAFTLNFIGSLAIALWPSYGTAIGGLFVIGLGMALLQVVINPLLRTAGGEAHFAFFGVMGQLVFGLASFLSPLAFQLLMERPGATGGVLVWVSFYWAFSAAFIVLIAANQALPLPEVQLKDDERAGGWAAYRELLARRDVRLFFLGIMAYVGSEQILANWMSQFLATYHGISATAEGADAVARFWGLMSLGCLLGLVLLKLLDSRVVLAGFATLAIACVALALFGPAAAAQLAFPAAGFFLSVMFSVVFSLGLNSVPRHHGAFSGVLCTGILGGAVFPLVVGVLGDAIGLRAAMSTVFLTLAYILGVSAWARPLVRNETVSLAQLLSPTKPRPGA